MDMRAFEAAIVRAQLFELAVILVCLILSILITYLVLRAAIRDGIRESGLIEALGRSATRTPRIGTDVELPDIRAER